MTAHLPPQTTFPNTDLLFQSNFILGEEAALKQMLTDATVVTDLNKNQRRVRAYYAMPDAELRKQTYPYITLDLLDIHEDRPRVMSSYGPLQEYHFRNYAYDRSTVAPESLYALSPVLLTYQIDTWARQPRHDRQILSQLMTGVLHPRFAQIGVDDNWRRMMVVGFSKRDTTVEEKRLFRNVWTVQIPSEIFYDPVTLTPRVMQVIINSDDPDSPQTESRWLYPGID